MISLHGFEEFSLKSAARPLANLVIPLVIETGLLLIYPTIAVKVSRLRGMQCLRHRWLIEHRLGPVR